MDRRPGALEQQVENLGMVTSNWVRKTSDYKLTGHKQEAGTVRLAFLSCPLSDAPAWCRGFLIALFVRHLGTIKSCPSRGPGVRSYLFRKSLLDFLEKNVLLIREMVDFLYYRGDEWQSGLTYCLTIEDSLHNPFFSRFSNEGTS